MAKSLIILLLICNTAFASNEEEAVKNAATAAYKQFGLEDDVNRFVEKTVPEDIKKIAVYIGPVVDVFIRQKVEYRWNF